MEADILAFFVDDMHRSFSLEPFLFLAHSVHNHHYFYLARDYVVAWADWNNLRELAALPGNQLPMWALLAYRVDFDFDARQTPVIGSPRSTKDQPKVFLVIFVVIRCQG